MNLKILIATGIFPPDIGGPATIIKELQHSLEQRGHEVKIMTYADTGGWSGNVYRVRRRGAVWAQYFDYFWQLLRQSRRADVIYATDIYSVGYFAYLAKILLGKKYVIRFAGDSAWETAVGRGWTADYIVDFQRRTYGKKIEKLKNRRRKILVKADRVVAVSNFLADVAGLIGVPKEKINVIYNSVDFAESVTADGAAVEAIKRRYKAGGKLLVTICRLTPWKGVDGIIRILPQLNAALGPVSLLVLGDGSELDKLQALAADLRLEKNVNFLGRVPRAEVKNYLQASDLFVLNSNYEGFSHSILEAMQAGLPVVATNIGGNPEVIEQNVSGLLVDYNNGAQLLAACSKILNDPALAQSLVLAGLRQIKKYSWQNVVCQTEAVLAAAAQKS